MTSPLDYVPTPLPDGGVINFSPSKFANFINRPFDWFATEVLGEKGFEYSTASVIGTCVHYCAEQLANEQDVDIEEIEKYILSHKNKDDFDAHTVMEEYREPAEELVNSYVLEQDFLEVEKVYQTSLGDGFYVGGKCDALQGTKEDCMVTDYKTYRSKTKPKAFSQEYRYQLLVYAYILRQLGYNVTRIRLVYVNRHIDGGISEKTSKPLKSYPSEVTVLTETVMDEDIDFIESMLLLAKDKILAWKAHPELAHVIWHDPRRKPE